MMLIGIHVPFIGTIRVGPMPRRCSVLTQFVLAFVGLFVLLAGRQRAGADVRRPEGFAARAQGRRVQLHAGLGGRAC